MKVRREVLGDEHVDRALGRHDRRSRADSRTSSPATPGARSGRAPGSTAAPAAASRSPSLTALGHEDELALHVRGALRNGLTPDEISEVLLHTAIYSGVPAANSAFAIAQKTLQEQGAI